MELKKYLPVNLAALLRSDEFYACIDVRERGEFALGQIPGTTPLPRGTLEYRVEKMIPGKFIPVIVCCDDGRRSELASLTLMEMGYENVGLLSGGLNGWKLGGFRTREGWGVGGKEYGEKVAVTEAVPQITADELAQLQRSGKTVVLIDVRTEEEYLRGHVPGALHVPGGQLMLQVPKLLDNEQSMAVISCAGRTRGILGAQMLREAGFRNVRALLNGAMGWKLAGYELEDGPSGGWGSEADAHLSSVVNRATDTLLQTDKIRFISCEDVKRFRESKDIFYLIDIRLPGEFRSGHIEGSISLPVGQIALAYENFIAVRKANLIILSDDAIRSVWAAALFQRLGFPRVFVLRGGIEAMAAQGFQHARTEAEQHSFGLERARGLVHGLEPRHLAEDIAKHKKAMILDVRGSGEYAFGHIPGAQWLARGKLEVQIGDICDDKLRRIVTVCDSGIRSALAAATLKALGYHTVEYLQGGLQVWQRDGLEIREGLDGSGVTREEAQADFGHTVWKGSLGKSRADMERYLAWEEALKHT